VGDWLAQAGRADLAKSGWSSSTYMHYLDQMHAWAEALQVDPETVEYLIFQQMSNDRGNQWSR
jgi:hypothetical protein